MSMANVVTGFLRSHQSSSLHIGNCLGASCAAFRISIPVGVRESQDDLGPDYFHPYHLRSS